MQVTGSATVAAPLARVWDALQDPAVLARTIPGCHSLEETAPGSYRMTISAGVASVRGTYVGRVELTDPDPPSAFTLRARGQGAPGTVDATVRVRLSRDGDGDGTGDGGTGGGSTRVDYDADAVVGGMIGGVGQRMLGGVAKRTAGEFFAAVERALTEPAAAAAPEAGPGPAAASGRVHAGRAAASRGSGRIPVWPMVAAFATGGLVALAGVALGHLLGRRAR
ncbi:carbon monoxide dehydrogenase subunit G [Actinomadura sp. NEAU-AAG7]|uniref:SRPBCC family protein n=1 Tax=Actinomadura sp. NEAU-AAG7 TaxID=2839640 RepID=UPI001BE3FE93|nr:carbon monoxide dehydrogenase subunit G [Actinomadura sp. NEAU-AAG7]MBT2209782.1 carbon monoxide dehydrogenase subunit G [Actinomadura sp. NEAU-AAG7]